MLANEPADDEDADVNEICCGVVGLLEFRDLCVQELERFTRQSLNEKPVLRPEQGVYRSRRRSRPSRDCAD